MDDNLSWKIVYIAVIFSMILMGVVYYLISPRESPFFTEEKMEKIAEFRNTRVSGRKEGKKVWELFAKEGWTARDREITYLFNISKGMIYMDGKLVVSQLRAPWAKTYRHSEIIEVFGHPEGEKKGSSKLNAYLELGRMSEQKSKDQSEWTRMTANCLKYIPKEKRSEITGDVALHKKDSSIYAQKIMIDHEQKVADISGNIKQTRKNGYLTCDNLKYFSHEERLEAEGHVYLNLLEGNIKTEVKAQRASLYSDINKDINISGKVEAVQGKKFAVANEGVYSQETKELLMKGEAKAIFEKAQAILKEKTARDLKNPEAKKILKEKTILTSDELIFSTKTGDASASGSVFVLQKGREAKADYAEYDDRKETLTLTGNVFMKKKMEWVSAKKVMVSVRDETFEAVGEVEAEFKL